MTEAAPKSSKTRAAKAQAEPATEAPAVDAAPDETRAETPAETPEPAEAPEPTSEPAAPNATTDEAVLLTVSRGTVPAAAELAAPADDAEVLAKAALSVPPAAAAPLEAPLAPEPIEKPATFLPNNGGYLVEAAAKRESVLLDSETSDLPVVEGLLVPIDEAGTKYTCTRRLVQVTYIGFQSTPTRVLAVAKDRVLDRVDADALRVLVEAQHAAAAALAEAAS